MHYLESTFLVQASTNYYARKEQITHTFLIFLSDMLVVGAAKQSLRPGQRVLREPPNRLSLYAPVAFTRCSPAVRYQIG